MELKYELGKKYKIVDPDNFLWGHAQEFIDKRKSYCTYEEGCYFFTAKDVNCEGSVILEGDRIPLATSEELNSGQVVLVEEEEDNKEITPDTEVTITTTYRDLLTVYHAMGRYSGRGALWFEIGDILDPTFTVYRNNRDLPKFDVYGQDYALIQEEWEELLFPKKSKRDKLIEEKQKQLEQLSKELEELKDNKSKP